MDLVHKLDDLRKKRKKLLQSYMLHISWLTLSIVFIYFDTIHISMVCSILLTLVTIPPVFIYTISVHRACRGIDPYSSTSGAREIIIFSIFLTPMESALVLPIKNIVISKNIINSLLAENKPTN